MTEDPRALMRRVQVLEELLRLLRNAGVCVLLAGAAILLMGQVAPAGGVIEGKDFILRDADGIMRARLSMDESLGGPFLQFYDERVPPRLRNVKGMNGKPVDRDRLAVALCRIGLVNGTPVLGLSAYDGRQSANLTVQDSGPQITLYDENGKGGMELTFIKGRGPAVTLIDADQNIRARLEVDRTEPFVKVVGTAGAAIYPLPRSVTP